MSESRKPTIYTNGLAPELARVLEPVKQSIEMITGARSRDGEIKGLTMDASLTDVIKKLNAVIARINASGSTNLQKRS